MTAFVDARSVVAKAVPPAAIADEVERNRAAIVRTAALVAVCTVLTAAVVACALDPRTAVR